MKTRMCLVLAVTAFLLGACDRPGSVVTITTTSQGPQRARYADAGEQGKFKKALASARIPFEVVQDSQGSEWVQFAPDQADAVAAVKRNLFGEELPEGRHVGMDGQADARFKAWLAANGIAYTIVANHGKDYVVWASEDTPRVRAWPGFPSDFWQRRDAVERQAAGR